MAASEGRPTAANHFDYYSAPQSPLEPTLETRDRENASNRENMTILTVMGIGLCCGIGGCYFGNWQYAREVEPIIAQGLTNDLPDFYTPFWGLIGFLAGTMLSTTVLISYILAKRAFYRPKR
jgi:hypothetical protein